MQLHQRIVADTQSCVGVKPDTVKTWQQDFNQLFKSWAAIQHIRFGPIAYLDRYERFHYWPDKHNRGNRQLQQLLAQDNSSLTLAQLQSKSIAIQGIGALEKLLLMDFSKEELVTGTSTVCDLILLITENLQQIAVKNAQAWVDSPVEFAKEFSSAGKSGSIFGSKAEIAKKLLGDMRTQIAVVESLKLGRAFAIIDEKNTIETRIKPKRLEAWRSRQSRELISINIAAIQELYSLGFAPHVKTKSNTLHQQIQTSFQQIKSALQAFDKPLYDELVESKEAKSNVQMMDLINDVKVLYQQLGNELPKLLGLTISFNALDGD